MHTRPKLAILCTMLLAIQGCSYAYELTLTGQVIRGNDHAPVGDATITLFTGNWDHCTTTSDAEGRWSLTVSISDIHFWRDDEGMWWLKSDPPYPSTAPKADHPYTIRVESDQGVILCPLPRISAPKKGNTIAASMMILLDAAPDEITD